MARYGSGDDETVITEYLEAHLEGGIKQKNLDFVLDLIDEYVELKESVLEEKIMTKEILKRAIEIKNDIDFLKKQTISVGVSKSTFESWKEWNSNLVAKLEKELEEL